MTQFEKTLKYLKDSATENLQASEHLFKGSHYGPCLFFCHLSLEKLLKAILVYKQNAPAPYIHSLTRLAELADIPLTRQQEKNLKEISDFNISGRYDDEKRAFYKKCTRTYSQKYLNITKQLFLWLKNSYLKK